MKTDRQLQRDVMDELVWDPSIDHAHIGVAAKGGVVTLSGFVSNYAQKMTAEHAAERVQGIAEELKVRFPLNLIVLPLAGLHIDPYNYVSRALRNTLFNLRNVGENDGDETNRCRNQSSGRCSRSQSERFATCCDRGSRCRYIFRVVLGGDLPANRTSNAHVSSIIHLG